MCGIAGAMAKTPGEGFAPPLEALMEALAHRGPDGRGSFKDHAVGLAHVRLSIIDLAGGAQPIRSPRGNLIIANGEIYNYPDIRAALGEAAFTTHSDSEGALALYEKHGEDFVTRLRGMYAFALYDVAQELLILHRDPFGIKPLYIAETAEHFLFASEAQSFFRAGLTAPEVRAEGAYELLQLKFTAGRKTVFAGVERVLPGETLFVKRGEIVKRTRINPWIAGAASAEGVADGLARLDAELIESVKAHTLSDVPYGVFLSGGVDSCSVIAAMMRLKITDFPCYTVRFPNSSLYDETDTARAAARAAGARHVEVEITESDFWATMPHVAAHMDDPAMDPVMIPSAILARRAAEDVKVVLCGNGGDEVFAGYRRYERAALPSFLRKKALRAKGQFDGSGLLIGAGDGWRAAFAASEAEAAANAQTLLQKLQATDCADFLPHYLLSTLDRSLMAYGVEGRTPLLDMKLSPFGFNLPDALKLKSLKGKWLLRKWLDGALPAARPFAKKRGFSVPTEEWIAKRAPSLASFVCDQPGVREHFRIDAVRALFTDNAHPQAHLRWPTLFFALWHEGVVRGRRGVTLPA
ncbi:MAG: asparagine synthase (glutamine-hydrolyzing) [Hydrogenophilaceae bacterium]|nr:asparagine synthase (glutamine-hydrolyzing) [Hydrogenophilaceae bacterium]